MATVSRSPTEDQHRVPADPVITILMTSRVVAVDPDMALIDAFRVMDSAGVRHLPVVDRGRCVVLLAELDMLRRLVADGLVRPESTARLTAGKVCRRPAPVGWCGRPGTPAAQVMLDSGSDAVLVLDDDHIHGIVTGSDLAVSLVDSGASVTAAEQQRPVAKGSPETGS
jgi:CBS domain-containing protein